MDEKNQQALALAFKRAKYKILKIKELGITPKYTAEQIDKLIEKLSKAKAKETETKWETHVKGQRWYVEDLVKLSALGNQELLDYEYAQSFPDVADESELLAELDKLAA